MAKKSTETLFSRLAIRLYHHRNHTWRKFLIRRILAKEGGDMYSLTVRRIAKQFHDLEIGLYSDCADHTLLSLGPSTRVGRYVSIANTSRTFTAQKPEYNLLNSSSLIKTKGGPILSNLIIGHDAWLGHNSVVMPSVSSIGIGAIIGANSVVQADVPNYAIMAGNPARKIGMRFSPERVEGLLASKWWEKPIEEISKNIDWFQTTPDGGAVR